MIDSFADRDHFMRFFGGGVGHSSTRKASSFFLDDRYPSDVGDGSDEEGIGEPEQEEDSEQEDSEEGIGEQEGDSEEELASNSESDVSEVFDFGYQVAGMDEESEDDDRQSDSDSAAGGQAGDGRGIGDDPEAEEGEWEDLDNDFEALGFASF